MDVNSKLADAHYGYSYQDELEEIFNHWISDKTDEDLIEFAEDYELDIRDENGELKDNWFDILAEYWIEYHAEDYDADWEYYSD
jgi:hypothetical protein